MRVKVRALIVCDGRVVVARERRQLREVLTIPGGRPKDRETLTDAVVREVEEETGVQITAGPLLYVAEVVGEVMTHEVNLIFRGNATGTPGDVLLVGPDDPARERVMPPMLDIVFADLSASAAPAPRFLGNLHRSRRHDE